MRVPCRPMLSALALLVLLSASAGAQEIPERLRGTWEIDTVASLAHSDGVVALDTVSEDDLRSALQARETQYRLHISDDSLTYERGSTETTVACSTRYRGPSVVYLDCQADSQDVALVVADVAEGIRLLSSATDDSDIYVWRRAGSVEKIWTPWLNRDTPGGSGDYETLVDFVESGQACAAPVDVECRARDGRSLEETGQTVTCEPGHGAVCVHTQQPDHRLCLDYEVRFLCPSS